MSRNPPTQTANRPIAPSLASVTTAIPLRRETARHALHAPPEETVPGSALLRPSDTRSDNLPTTTFFSLSRPGQPGQDGGRDRALKAHGRTLCAVRNKLSLVVSQVQSGGQP